MEERSLRVVGTDKTFFNKLTKTLTKFLIPTQIGINGMRISMKRNALIKAYEIAVDENIELSKSNGAQNCSGTSLVDFSWILFVGTKMLGFTEKEVGHFTFKKWDLLYTHFKTYHNFCISKQLFAEKENTTRQTSDEWLPT